MKLCLRSQHPLYSPPAPAYLTSAVLKRPGQDKSLLAGALSDRMVIRLSQESLSIVSPKPTNETCANTRVSVCEF